MDCGPAGSYGGIASYLGYSLQEVTRIGVDSGGSPGTRPQ